ncbi:transposase [Nocardiopsis sp. Huas11]|uniref:IS630 family transposase n=1 Tax=Nocardiopsis sp. Huas11 TaxID=2183912 RepID=UPI000EAFC40E|nr:IS630 family transposase [Nocardiopsis sp. Huas11]RKS04554.1 transposase [Nocardiopsis sp. Huas11]RKS06395.1 transposase [Nocardiopsis sp. Huas11]
MSAPGPKLPPLELSDEEHAELQRWIRRRKTAQDLALRARIVLACAEGLSNAQVRREVGVSAPTVTKWRQRFIAHRMDGLTDEPRPGRPRTITDAQVEAVVAATLESTPAPDTHWSTRSMAEHTGMTQNAVWRIWNAFGLQPHRREQFKISTDPFFIDKVRDVVGLYLDPPERAVALCVDEKSQIQALNRTQPVLPMMPGTPERATHDYVRAGVTSLFAALDTATGQVITSIHRRHRAIEFKKFLAKIDREVPADLQVHLILDNYATHKTAEVRRWLVRHPRFHLHFIPTSSSWLNLVERWFAEITNRLIRRGTHRSVQALEKDIRAWAASWNENPRPYVWTKTAEEILESLASYCQRISKRTNQSEH